MIKNCFVFLICSLFGTSLFSQPVVTSINPATGPVGSNVTIKGTGFGPSATDNSVYFGAVKATVSSCTDTTIFVTVPPGATYQPVTVTTNNLTGYSINSFVVTFAGGGGSFTSTSFIPAMDVTTGIYPHCALLADFNNDGRSDILVSRGSSGNVSVLPNATTGSTLSFGTQLNLTTTGNNHEGGAIADFDGDGKLDFIITNSIGSNSVSVFRNTSAGTTISFAAKIDFAADNSPYSVAAGDLDGDGKPDLVIANNGSNVVTVYRNLSTLGNISFGSRTDLPSGTNPYSVAIGDLNGDRKPEVIITTQGSSSSLSVMKNNSTTGTISLGAATPYGSLAGSFIVAVGDLDNDGLPDLAAASSGSNSVVVLRNTSAAGNISFESGQLNFTTGNYPVCVAISDLNGDGMADLVTSNRFSNNVSCLKNITVGSSISFETHVDYAVNTDPFYVTTGDLDGDSRPDIIAANSASTSISILKNIVGAAIAPTITSFTPTSGVNGTSVTIIGSNYTGATAVKFGGVPATSFTVDSSGGITAIVGTGASGDVSVTTVNGTVTLAGFTYNGPIITAFTPMIGVTGTVVTITGVNLNGATAVKFGGTAASSFTVNSSASITATVGSGSSGSVSVTTPNGTATLAGFSFGPPTITSFTPLSGEVGSTVTITGTNFSSTASANTVFFGAVKATVTAATSTQLLVVVPAGATYQPVSVTTNNLTAYSSLSFSTTFLSDNPHLTTSSFSVAVSYATGVYPRSVAISDLNDDGKPDLIIGNSTSNNMTVYKNNSTVGNIAFGSRVDYATATDPVGISIGDLDGDSKPDIVVVGQNSGTAAAISVFRNTSTGGTISLGPKQDFATGDGTTSVSIADMNGDGKPDIITASGNSGFFSIFLNTTTIAGTISFASRQDFTLFFHPSTTTCDLNKDGLPDIISANFGSASSTVFKNTSTGGNLSLDARLDYAVGNHPSRLTTGDLDGDGKADVAVANYNSGNGNISLLKNNSSASIISLGNAQEITLFPTNIAVIDLNGDGKPDLCTGRWLNGLISVLENTYSGSGSFSFGTSVDFTAGTFDTFVAAGDLDGDGKPEIVAGTTTANTVAILRNVLAIPSPVITSLSASVGGSGSSIVINGSNFTGVSSVKFGGTPAASFNLVSSARIDATIGGGASGNVTVTNGASTATIAGFNFIPAITAGGTTSFCNGASVTLTSTAAANNQWYKDAAAVNGATGTSFQATTSGDYTVKTTSNGITTTSPTAITVAVTIIPPPVITLNANNQLVSSVATGNQWYKDGTIITGATDQTYQPTQSGNYTVKTTANGCTSDFSAAHIFTITGIINLGNDQFIKIYPNPVKDKLFLTWNINSSPLLNIEINDSHGRQMLVNRNISSGAAIDLSLLAQGVYFIKVYNNKLKIYGTVKIVKQN